MPLVLVHIRKLPHHFVGIISASVHTIKSRPSRARLNFSSSKPSAKIDPTARHILGPRLGKSRAQGKSQFRSQGD